MPTGVHPAAVKWFIFKNKYLVPDNPDSIIIAESVLVARKNKAVVHFVTSDLLQALIAEQFKELYVEYYQETNLKEHLWTGFKDCLVSDTTLSHLYENLNNNILDLTTNEYAVLRQNEKVVDLIKWNGETYDTLKYKDIKSDFFGTVQPRNIQ